MPRLNIPALDDLLGVKLPVLDDGFIMVVDYMGGDSSVVQAARVSYGDGTKTVSSDGALIRYLMRHHHTTPFEMVELKLLVRVPMDCWRQWIRHRTASVNEYSTRYSVAIDSAQATMADSWRLQAVGNKQGSGGQLPVDVGQALSDGERQLHDLARRVYMQRLDAGVAREQARKDLPLSTYTEAFWKIDLHNLMNFLRLRLDSHAQVEIREYARTIAHRIMPLWVPLAWEAFQDHVLNTVTLSSRELVLLKAVLAGDPAADEVAVSHGWIELPDRRVTSREGREFLAKARRLGLDLHWTAEEV